jgi:energy-coupling factor transporter ATP-binding protein EcfA2
MRLTSLTLTNFRGFAALTLDLDRPLTVLAGINGAGKSSLLDAASMVLGTAAVELLAHPLVIPALSPRDVRRGSHDCAISAALAFGAQRARVTIKATIEGTLTLVDGRGPELRALSGLAAEPASCLALYNTTARTASPDLRTRWKDGTSDATAPLDALKGALATGALGFDDLFRWFRDREDYENAEKVRRASLAWTDPQLDAVRAAVTALLPGFSKLRVDRSKLRMVVEKRGEEFSLEELSDGERTLLAVVADLARRLAIANPGLTDALQGEAVVLIDEIELHLHPSWQRAVLGALTQTFPRCQFIVTTHSPQVLSEVANDAVALVKDFACYHPAAPTEGRDSNAILWEVLGVTARPAVVAVELDAISDLLDSRRYNEARTRLDRIAEKLTERDPEVQGLRGALDVVERLDASEPREPAE